MEKSITFEKLEAENPNLTPLGMIQKYAGEEIGDSLTAIYALQSILYLYVKEAGEQEGEAAAQAAALRTAIENLKIFIASEIQEVTTDTAVALTEGTDDLAKTGARNSAADQNHIQGIHDHAAALGAKCGSAEKAEGAGDDIAKIAGERDEALQKIAVLTGENETLQKRVKEFEALPNPPKGKVHTVDKADDSITKKVEEKAFEPIRKLDGTVDQEATALELIKKAHQRPVMVKLV